MHAQALWLTPFVGVQAAPPQSYSYAEPPATAYPTHVYSSAAQQQPALQVADPTVAMHWSRPQQLRACPLRTLTQHAAVQAPPAAYYPPPAAPSIAPRPVQYVTVAAPAPYYPPAAAAASAATAHSAHDLAGVKVRAAPPSDHAACIKGRFCFRIRTSLCPVLLCWCMCSDAQGQGRTGSCCVRLC